MKFFSVLLTVDIESGLGVFFIGWEVENYKDDEKKLISDFLEFELKTIVYYLSI